MLGGACALAGWQCLTWLCRIPPFFLPSPWDVAGALHRHRDLLGQQTWVTSYETVSGFALGASAGLLMAVLLTASAILQRATLPLVIALNAVPKVALAPLLVVWFGPLGLGPAPRITLAALICFFPILLATMTGLGSTPAELVELARSLSASRWRTFVAFRLPYALPQVFVGLKLGITLAVIGSVVAQIARPAAGLGAVIVRSGQSADTPLAFAAVVLLMVLSVTLFYLVVAVERVLTPWAAGPSEYRRTRGWLRSPVASGHRARPRSSTPVASGRSAGPGSSG